MSPAERNSGRKTTERQPSLLDSIDSPNDLKTLDLNQLPQLAAEIREFMVSTVSRHGGHLAPSLGAVDLTIALHYCYNTPHDKLVWDVGHQAYAHKILTGRRDGFDTLREYGGISGFPRVSESEYDTFTVGHASTSISAALGMAMARDIRGEKFRVAAIIGDGSLSAGLAFEGLNNLGSQSTDMAVILNDNEMSIAKNVGALSKYLTRVLTDKRFNKLKSDVWELLGNLPRFGRHIRNLVHNVDDAVKHLVVPGRLFEDLGLRYFGPVDGHNIAEMIEILRFVRETDGPVLLHVLTKKGKGYSFAEDDSTKFHGIGKFTPLTGSTAKSKGRGLSYSDVFGKAMVEIGEQRDDVVAVTAAMPDGTGLTHFRDKFPKRFFDVGIAEGHAVTFAAGLATQGLCPVVAIYSTFLQRAYDHILHDVALDGLHVVFCLDRAGLVGEDGPTHHGTFDISYLRSVPGAVIMAPSDEVELRNMLYTAVTSVKGPCFIRYPRGSGRGATGDGKFTRILLCEPRTVRTGKHCAFVSLGDCLEAAEEACDILDNNGISPTLVDARFAKPLKEVFYRDLFAHHERIVTLESNSLTGGFGSAVLVACAAEHSDCRVLTLGYPDEWIPHGNKQRLLEELGLTPEFIAARVQAFVNK